MISRFLTGSFVYDILKFELKAIAALSTEVRPAGQIQALQALQALIFRNRDT